MKNKTKRQGKITALLLTTAILVGCFTTACQPTPKSEIIAGKNNGLLEEKLNGEAATERYEAPTTYADEYSAYDDRLNVKIDADVTLGMDTFAVSSFEKVSKFSAEEGQRFLTALVGDKQLYAMTDGYTKSDLEEQLIQLKKSYEAKKNGEDMDEDEGGSTLDDYEKMMQDLEAQIANAPAEIEKQEVSSYNFNGDYFDATFENNDGTSGRVQIGGSFVTYWRQGIQYYYIGNGNTIDGDLPHLKIRKAEAVEKATELVNTMGITDYVPINVVEGAAVESGLDDPQADEKVYCIVFQRGFENATPFSDLNTSVGGSDSEYAKYIEPEALYVYIDDAGIEYVEWRGFNRLKEELNRNVERLPFENIMEKFKTYETVSNAFFEEYSDYRQIITIKKITLGYVEVRQKNTEDCVMYVPAWRFYGTNQSTDINGKWSENDANENELILTINAIDGTWIGI